MDFKTSFVMAVLASFTSLSAARAETCAPDSFAASIDASGAALRTFNADAQPKLKERIRTLRDKKKWGDDYEEKAYDYLQDGRTAEFDVRSNELLDKIDTLGRQGEAGGADCSKLNELKASGEALLSVMREKSTYLLGKVDLEIGAPPVVAAAIPPEKKQDPSPPAKAPEPVAGTSAKIPAPPKPAAKDWTTSTKPVPTPSPPSTPQPQITAIEPIPAPMPGDTIAADDTGYTIDEIRDASRGFFGDVSTAMASVIEHTFRNSGRPTGYVLGSEGGGALLAGLRYGDGTLFFKRGVAEKVYWHGPSIGTDLGASGSRTLFLIYRLKDKAELYRSFTGVDGSAYLIGGVGVTLMKGGDVVMAPIRSGLGLRIGANIGYLRFTSRPTWNPF
jgi:hypothetical protein